MKYETKLHKNTCTQNNTHFIGTSKMVHNIRMVFYGRKREMKVGYKDKRKEGTQEVGRTDQ